MAAKSCIAPAILWNWVIETLANSEQTDTRTLIDLVKMAPEISGDAGKDAREMVSFRILESLFSHDKETVANTDSARKDKISFNSSERCEDVLKQILDETPDQITKLQEEKWNIRPFLMQKRSSLPKCSLKKLKEKILESSHPLFASLKEKGNLVITSNASEDTSPVIDNVQSTPANDDLDLNPRKDKNVLQEAGQEHEMVIEKGNSVIRNASEDTSPVINDDVSPKKDINEYQEHMLKESDQERNERNEFADKKEAFLNSQLMSEVNVCIKCNEGGQLLICNSESCPFRVHESCLGFNVTLDEIKNFLCPFCAYSSAIPRLLEAKKNASRARKNLEAYSNFSVKLSTNETPKKQSELEKNEGNGDENNVISANDINHMSNDNMHTENETGVIREMIGGNEDENNVIRDDNINHMSNEEDYVVNDEMNMQTECLNQQTSELTQNPRSKRVTRELKRKERESQQRSTEASSSRRLRNRKRKAAPDVPPPAPLLRRTPMVWTKEEEEILKEGIARFPIVDHRGIQWKKILDFGRDVFHKDRTNIDLKDKWRNICRPSANAKLNLLVNSNWFV